MNLHRILVVGGGMVGWSAAAALKRRLPTLDVTILPIAPPTDALADRIASTLPSILGFHGDLGIGLGDAALRTDSGYRLGTLFSGWVAGAPDYVHAYGPTGMPIGGAPFHQLWARAALSGDVPPFDSLSTAAVMARAGRFVTTQPEGLLSEHSFGLTLDIPRYTAMLMAFAQHVGVQGRLGDVALVEQDSRGDVAAVILDDGTRLTADLYCDCTGPAARLHGRMAAPREDWQAWLPCDRILVSNAAPGADAMPMEHVTAMDNGWRWAGPRQSGAVYCHEYGGSDPDAVAFRSGATLAPWRGNVVALGDAAVSIEPLEWSNLHLAHSAIDRLIAMLPAGRPHPLEAAEYNRQAVAEARRVRDFLVLHYVTARRDAPFWKAQAQAGLPDSLAHTLRLFRERGRLPYYEEETFDRESWLAVLFGQRVLPRRIDPLTDAVAPADAAAAMESLRQRIARETERVPTAARFRALQLERLHERA